MPNDQDVVVEITQLAVAEIFKHAVILAQRMHDPLDKHHVHTALRNYVNKYDTSVGFQIRIGRAIVDLGFGL
mgnify:CR=1 FL=1